MMRLNPDATFDCLFLASRFQTQGTSFSAQEIHLFSYLACLLWLYRQNAVADWGYDFMGTELGAPFSREIDLSLKELLERGHLRKINDRLVITELTLLSLSELTMLTMNNERSECLHAACSSTAAFSVGMVSSALAQEPELSRAKAIPLSRLLLEDVARSNLYTQFDALRLALHDRGDDLRLPAVVWLSALYRMNRSVVGEA